MAAISQDKCWSTEGDTVSPEVKLVLNLPQTVADPVGTRKFMCSEGNASASICRTLQDRRPENKWQCFTAGHMMGGNGCFIFS